jgi:hypothetical protein
MQSIEEIAHDRGVIVIFAVLLVLSLGCFGSSGEDNESSQPEEPAAAEQPEQPEQTERSETVGVGEEGYIWNRGADVVAVSVSEEALDKRIKAAAANDREGFAKLLETGEMFTVPADTKVRVLEGGLTQAKVRILDGEKNGEAGWVTVESIHGGAKNDR